MLLVLSPQSIPHLKTLFHRTYLRAVPSFLPVFGLFIFCSLCSIIASHICQTNHFEVTIIRKTTFFALLTILFALVLVTPMKTYAAETDSHVGAVTTGGGNLYVRKSPSTASSILASLKKGSYVTLMEKSGDWWKVEYADNLYGYCYAGYITPVEGKAVHVNTGGNVLNVRTGPGTSYNRIATLPHGDIVMLRSTADGWSRVLYHGTKLGYVSSQYLTGQSTGSTGTNTVSLKVPSYKQTDSRWASYPLGTRGGTIGTIGCAVTGIAMMESYRTGTTIYPDAMAKKLSFTSGGGVYWPSHYTAVTTLDLSKIRSLLEQGKPVLLGGTTNSGRQHWVVITGFTGGSLTAANFTVNDPGSNSRTTLQQYFNSFPNFYKYFYY